jgi:RNA polymerase sigma-70 factor (ECF subfamily)
VTDADLERALLDSRQGDEWAIALLFRSIQPQLLRYLSRKAPGVAEDVASETWLAVAAGLSRFEGSMSDFRALVFTIARRRVVDHYRRQGRRLTEVALDNGGGAPERDVADLAVESLSTQQAIDALVAILPPAQAEVVLLRVVADLRVEDVARVMGRSPGSVRILQHRALRKLEKHLNPEAVTN